MLVNKLNVLTNAEFPAVPVFQSLKTSQFFQNKDRVPKELLSSIVYVYQCNTCPSVYVGKTTRHFGKRMTEHLSGHLKTEDNTHCHQKSESDFKCFLRDKNCDIGESLVIKQFLKEGKTLLNNQLAPITHCFESCSCNQSFMFPPQMNKLLTLNYIRCYV